MDYPSGMRCCSNIPVERCDPDSAMANNACRDVCHYGGCRKGGHCVHLGWGVGRACQLGTFWLFKGKIIDTANVALLIKDPLG